MKNFLLGGQFVTFGLLPGGWTSPPLQIGFSEGKSLAFALRIYDD
jgi:hypothetical protein